MSLRQWMNAVQLLESINTDGMAASIEKAWVATKGGDPQMNAREGARRVSMFKAGMEWAHKSLKRADRVSWYARWLRISMIHGTSEFYPALKEYADRFGVEIGPRGLTNVDGEYLYHAYEQFRRMVRHLLSLNYPPLNDFKWTPQITPTKLFDALHELEDRYKQAQKVFIPYEDENEILAFPDGYRWVNLGRGACGLEAEAMGHCGNEGSSDEDTILSLRQIVTKNGAKYWRPSLTFILNTRTGMLGEMKGRANNKPKTSYHPYIVALLRLPIIKGIVGGGYKPESNFSLADLDEATREELVREKPALLSPSDYLARFGLTEELKRRLEAFLTDGEVGGQNMTWHGTNLITGKRPWRKIVREHGTGSTVHLLGVYNTDARGLVRMLDSKALAELLRVLPADLRRTINRLMKTEDGFMNPSLMNALQQAHLAGRAATAHSMIENAFANVLNGYDDGFNIWNFEGGEFTKDGNMVAHVPLDRLIEFYGRGEAPRDDDLGGQAILIQPPPEKWDGKIDKQVAADTLRNALKKNDLI